MKSLGEVFTPQFLVERVLNHVPPEVLLDCAKTVLDNSCGDGQFLVEVMQRRRIGGATHQAALSTIYGIDVDELNVKQCRERLLMGSTDEDLLAIVNHNIILADALDPTHPGWELVGYMWDEKDLEDRIRKRKFW